MKNKLALIFIGFIACSAAIGHGAEKAPAVEIQTPQSSQPAALSSPTAQTKLEQANTALAEAKNLLKQKEQDLAAMQERNKPSKKTDAAQADYVKAIEGIKKEIQKLREQIKWAEDELAAQTKKNDHYNRVQAEFAKAQKERLDAESKTSGADSRLVAAQKNLSELKSRYMEVLKQVNDAKKQARDLENAMAVLEAEKAQRAAAIARAEKAVALAENAEKERLLLASQISDLERNLPTQKQVSPDISKITDEIESEKKSLAETGEKIKKEEKARADAEKSIVELQKQLKALEQRGRSKEKDENQPDRLKAQLAEVRKQRAAGEEKLRKAEAKLLENEKSIAGLTNRLAAAEARADTEKSASISDQTAMENDIRNERQLLSETADKIKNTEKSCDEAVKQAAELRRQLNASRETTRSSSTRKDDLKRRQAQLADLRQQRVEKEERAQAAALKLQEREKELAALTNMLAAAAKQAESAGEAEKEIALLTKDLEKETALMNEVAARMEKIGRDSDAFEKEKNGFNERLLSLRSQIGKDTQSTNKLNEVNFQLAEQKKQRVEIDNKVRDAIQKQEGLQKEIEKLKLEVIEADSLRKQNETTLKTAADIEAELRREKELAGKYANLQREKELDLTRLSEEKNELQAKLNESEAKLARQKEAMQALEEKRRALEEQKILKAAAEKRCTQLVQAEQEQKGRMDDLKNTTRATEKESQSLSRKIEKIKPAAPAGTAVSQGEAAGSAESGEEQGVVKPRETTDANPLAAEQDLINRAKSGDKPAAETVPRYDTKVKSAGKNRLNRIAEAEIHYASGIQKWDEDDLAGAISEFKETIRLNPDAAGAYYNLSLAYLRQGKKEEACEYAYKAGECYLRLNNSAQAARMTVLMMKIDKNSPRIEKLRNKIAAMAQ